VPADEEGRRIGQSLKTGSLGRFFIGRNVEFAASTPPTKPRTSAESSFYDLHASSADFNAGWSRAGFSHLDFPGACATLPNAINTAGEVVGDYARSAGEAERGGHHALAATRWSGFEVDLDATTYDRTGQPHDSKQRSSGSRAGHSAGDQALRR
jgi:hypothetical protein